MRYLQNRKKAIVALALLTALVLASCSGSGVGNSGSIAGISLSPLVVADNVSVVDPQQQSGGSSPQFSGFSLISALVFGGLPPGSDYVNDRVTVYVNERSMDTFGTINEILCSVKQSRYDAMINRGPYLALVDKNLCSSNRSDASSTGQASTNQSSGSTMPDYQLWTVDSTRSSSSSPHIVRVWVHEKPTTNSPNGKLIIARMVITEGVDTAPPYGIFKIDFKAVDPPSPLIALFTGFLAAERDPGTGKILLKFATEDKDSYMIQKATLDKAANGTTGAGTALTVTDIPFQTPTTDRFDIAYDPNHFLRTDNTGTQTCLDRKNYDVSAWRYGLYDNVTGSRVSRNSGFSIRKGAAYGWVGYWGLWLPQGVTVNNGDTVYKHDYSNNTETPYAIVKSGGKLKKHTKQSTTLGNIKNIPLDYWEAGTNFRVIWNDTLQVLQKVAQQDPTDWTWGTITPAALNLGALNSPELVFWSQSLGGPVRVKLTGCILTGTFNCTGVPTSATPVVYYAEDIVYPTDAVPATLACFDMCPDSTVLSSPTSSATFTTPYRTDISSYQTGTLPTLATHASFTFAGSSSSMTLTDANGAVELAVTNPNFTWGIGSGPLFDPTPANLNLLDCNWDLDNNPLTNPATCGWQAWSALTEFYTWETGPNTWNQFTALVDGIGAFVRFDPPLHVQYTHQAPVVDPTPADIKYDGVTFFLEYSGFGELQGIPGKCVNMDTGADADCSTSGGSNSIRWVPEFTIPNQQGTDYTEVTGQGGPYIVKALEREERMRGVPVLACTSSGLTTTSYTLPSMSSWANPVIGTEPVITSPPAVIGGVVQ